MHRLKELLEWVYESRYEKAYDGQPHDEISDLLQFFLEKEEKAQLRESYSKIVFAQNEDERHEARLDYLWHKNRINPQY